MGLLFRQNIMVIKLFIALVKKIVSAPLRGHGKMRGGYLTQKKIIMVKFFFSFFGFLRSKTIFLAWSDPLVLIQLFAPGAHQVSGARQLSKEWLRKNKNKARFSNFYMYNHVIPLSNSRKKITSPLPPSGASLSQFLLVCSTICISRANVLSHTVHTNIKSNVCKGKNPRARGIHR